MADVPDSTPLIRPWRLALAGIYSLVVAGLSLFPSPHVTRILRHQDLLAHAILYFTFAMIWMRVPLRIVKVLPIAIVFGALMEVFQIFIPGRAFSLMDILANTVGATLACIIAHRWINSSS